MNETIVPHLEIFRHGVFGRVRSILINGTPWFIARDVAKALKYSDPTKAIRTHCLRAEKYTEEKRNDLEGAKSPTSKSFTFTTAPYIISEGDVYRLVVRSKMRAAQKFEEWLFDEVLPTLREAGRYSMREEDKFAPTLSPIVEEYKAARFFAKEFGLVGSKVTVAAVGAVKRLHDIDLFSVINPEIPVHSQEVFLSPTEMGYRLNCSAQKANRILEAAGFQSRTRRAPDTSNTLGRLVWNLTDEGKEYGKYFYAPVRGRTSFIQRIGWSETVVSVLRGRLDEGLKVKKDTRGQSILTLVGKTSK